MVGTRLSRPYRALQAGGACAPALRWVERSGFSSLQEVWGACDSPDWLLWALCEFAPRTRFGPEIAGVEETVRHLPTTMDRADQNTALCEAIRLIVPRAPQRRGRRAMDDIPF